MLLEYRWAYNRTGLLAPPDYGLWIKGKITYFLCHAVMAKLPVRRSVDGKITAGPAKLTCIMMFIVGQNMHNFTSSPTKMSKFSPCLVMTHIAISTI